VVLAHVLAGLEVFNDLLNGSLLHQEVLHLERLATTAGLLLVVLKRLLGELDVLDAQLLVDDLEVANGVDVTLDVNDLGVIEATDDLEDGVDGADVGQERVSETGTGGCTTGQTSNVIDREVSGHLGLGLVLLAQPVEAVIGHDDTGLFGVDGSVGEVGWITEVALGNGLEQRRFTYVGETNLRRR